MERVKVTARQGQSRCPYCMDDLDGELFECACGATYHQACVKELKTCAVLGCERSLRQREPSGVRVGFLRQGSGPVLTRGPEPRNVVKGIAAFLLVLFMLAVALVGGSQQGRRQESAPRPFPVQRRGEIPGHLLLHRQKVVDGLRGLVRARVQIEELRAQGEDQRVRELEMEYQTELQVLLHMCDDTPLAGGPAAFQREVRKQVGDGSPPRFAQRVLADFFGAPGW